MRLFKVSLSVRTIGGDKITLSPAREIEVERFVNSLLTARDRGVVAGRPEKLYKHKKKHFMFGRRLWTEEERIQVEQYLKEKAPQTKKLKFLFREVAQMVGRTPHAAGLYIKKHFASYLPLKTGMASAKPEETIV